MSFIARTANELAESGIFPDSFIRSGIRRLVERRRQDIAILNEEDLDAFARRMSAAEIALVPELANEQHYEVPASFFEHVLGVHRKYSCCYWGQNTDNAAVTLDEAEERSLRITCERAELADGQRILELGCGWGSLSLWMASQYPRAQITSVSNSSSQKVYIDSQAQSRGIENLTVITADMNDFATDEEFDRVVSVEMFEHMRNYARLFERLSAWLADDGLFFMHIFCHKHAAYEYVDAGPQDWMSRHFFSGGIMPSHDLPLKFPNHLDLKERWLWSGREYQQTAEAWLANMDARKALIMPVLASTYGLQDARRWWSRWRIFFLAVSEMFGTDAGREWGVGHYLFTPKRALRT